MVMYCASLLFGGLDTLVFLKKKKKIQLNISFHIHVPFLPASKQRLFKGSLTEGPGIAQTLGGWEQGEHNKESSSLVFSPSHSLILTHPPTFFSNNDFWYLKNW